MVGAGEGESEIERMRNVMSLSFKFKSFNSWTKDTAQRLGAYLYQQSAV